jgi:MoaA/NifB/PqqE/SkfB family radical SAM enzyme
MKRYLKLLQGICSNEKPARGPFFCSISLTQRCNSNCTGCRFHSNKAVRLPGAGQDIAFDIVDNLLRELHAMDTSTLLLSGEGEPLLHPRIFDITRRAKELRFNTTILTNGKLLNERSINTCIDQKVDTLQVSLWAATPQTYIRQYPGADTEDLHTVLAALKKIAALKKARRSLRPRVNLHCPINRNNYREVAQLARLAHELGCQKISFAPLVTYHGRFASDALTPQETTALITELKRLRNELAAEKLANNIPLVLLQYRVTKENGWRVPCYIGWYHTRVLADGTVVPCSRCSIPLGNLRKDDFTSIWHAEPYRNFRKKTSAKAFADILEKTSDCNHCCFAENNLRVERAFRYVRPFLSKYQAR